MDISRLWTRFAVVVLGALVAMCALAIPAQAAKGNALDGTFAIKGTITGDDDPSTVGSKIDRTYEFSCKGKCNKVDFLREGANNSHSDSVLKRASGDTFKGTEVQDNPICLDGSKATSRVAKITVEITKAKNGVAAKIKGELHFKTTGCADDTFQDTVFTGKAK